MPRLIRLLLLTLLVPLVALAAPARADAAGALRAEVVNPPVNLGDTFELLISLIGRDSLEPPNIAVLQKDFEVLDRSKGGRNTMVDGREVPVTLWLMTLAPKRAGRLVIPALSVGGETTAPIQLVVAPGAVPAPPEDEPVSIRVDVAGTPPYFALSDIPVRVRVYDRVGASTTEPPPPIADGMPLVSDGAWRIYTRTFGGQRYRIVERRYILRPQREGVVTILPVPFFAVIPGATQDAARRVELRSAAVDVTVLPHPDGVEGWFLPARAVMLTRSWSSPLAQARVGGALTSTITVAALGASANQLPSLAIPAPDDVRQYAEETRREPALVEGERGAAMEMQVSVVPTRAGKVTLPAISVPWWNTQTGKAEVAVLPEQSFTVAPSAGPAAPVAGARAPRSGQGSAEPGGASAAPAAVTGNRAAGPGGAVAAAAPETGTGIGPWMSVLVRSLISGNLRDGLLAAGAAAVVAIGALVLIRRRRAGPAPILPPAPRARPAAGPAVRRPRQQGGSGAGAAQAGGDAAVRALEAACRAGDARAAHRAYLAWRGSLGAAGPGAAPLTPRMAEALHEISRHLYGTATGDWDAGAFRKAFAAERRAMRRGRTRAPAARLAPLYPGAR